MSPDQILTALGLLLAPEPSPVFATLYAGGYDPRYPVTVSACPETAFALDIEGQTVICGTVSVPENYDIPEGRRVELRFALGKSYSTQPFNDAIIYLHGGPGAGALDSIAAATEVILGGHRQFRDVVTFDQRAAMLSSQNVRCYEAMAENIVGLVREVAGRPTPEGEEPFNEMAFLKPCVDEIYASGADLTQYNTTNNARDVRALMTALGYPTYNIFGISYGTRLGLEVLRSAPEGVRAVLLDGVAPPTVKLYDALLPPHVDAMEALFDQCAAQPACAAAYPDLRAKFIEAGTYLADNPIPAARGKPPISVDLFYGVIQARTFYSYHWLRDLNRYLPRIIYEMAAGDPTTFDWYLDTYAEPKEPTAAAVLARRGAKLTDDETALATAIYSGAQSVKQQEAAISAALQQLKHDVNDMAEEVTVAEAFDRRATVALMAMDKADVRAAVKDYALFQTGTPSRDRIAAWVRTHFIGPDQASLLALVGIMTEADIARTYAIADADLWKYQLAVEGDLGLAIYACQEDQPYNSRDGGREVSSSVPYPAIASKANLAAQEGIYDLCDLFEPAPREGFHEPVVSDVPVLLLGGTNDTQTSWKWSALAAETLSQSQVIIYPNAGHGSSLYSQCGLDINTRFILDPTAELDTSCLDAMVPVFVLPDAPVP